MIKEELLNANADQLLQQKGIIANIERYAINDGNGIRTTVFTKGCNLRFKCCSKTETQAIYPEMTLISEKCLSCLNCLRDSPYK